MSSVNSFLKGVVVGAAAGLLFAPKSGKKLRADLMSKVDDAKNQANDYREVAMDKGMELQQQAKEAAGNIKISLKDTADQVKHQMEHKAEDLKDKAQDVKQDVKDKAEDLSSNGAPHKGAGHLNSNEEGREKENYSKGPGVAGPGYNKATDLSGDEQFSDYTSPDEFAKEHGQSQSNSGKETNSKNASSKSGEEKGNYAKPGTGTSKQASDTSGEEKKNYGKPSKP